MDLYYNERKISRLSVSPQTTIREIKKVLSDWLAPQGITNYSIRLFFNDGNEVDNVVFRTSNYDTSNFEAQKELMYGGTIHVIPYPVTQQIYPEDIDQNDNRRRVKFSDIVSVVNIPIVKELKPDYTEPTCPKCNESHNIKYPCRRVFTVFNTKGEYDEYCELIFSRSTGEYKVTERKKYIDMLFNNE